MALRYGVVGTGEQAQEHLVPALRLLSGAEIVAWSSRDLHRAQAMCSSWGVQNAFDDWQAMASSGLVQALVVAGPPSLHAEVAAFCIPRGLHVFVEKPPAPNTSVLAELVALERRFPATATFVGFNFPYGASYEKLVGTLRKIDTPRMLKVRFISSAPRQPRWGCKNVYDTLLLGTACHPINMATRLFGRVAKSHHTVVALAGDLMHVTVLLDFENGAHAQLELGNYANRFEFRCELLGEGGGYGVLDQHNTLVFHGGARAAGLFDGKEEERYRWPSRRGGFERTGYGPELARFQQAALHRELSGSSFSDAVETYRVLDGIGYQAGAR